MKTTESETSKPDTLDSGKQIRLGYRFPPPRPPSWPWQATTLCALNCYLVWAFFWFQFLVTFCTFSYKGRNLYYYSIKPAPFGRSIPELFFAFSIALSIFACLAIIGGTYKTPKLWKRLLPLAIFSTISIGFSHLVLNHRHTTYQQALWLRENWLTEYHRDLVTHHDDEDTNRSFWLDDQLRRIAQLDSEILSYEEKYQIPPAIAFPMEHPKVDR